MRLVQGMYDNAQNQVHIGEGYSQKLEVKVIVHQGSVLSPLLFIFVLVALSGKFHSRVPKLPLVIIACNVVRTVLR